MPLLNQDCWHLICSHLADDYRSLYDLLQVNKEIFHAVVAFIYATPWLVDRQSPWSPWPAPITNDLIRGYSKARLEFLIALCSGHYPSLNGTPWVQGQPTYAPLPSWTNIPKLPTFVDYYSLVKVISRDVFYYDSRPISQDAHTRAHAEKLATAAMFYSDLPKLMGIESRLITTTCLVFRGNAYDVLTPERKEMALEFVRNHVKLFPGLLKEVKMDHEVLQSDFLVALQEALGNPQHLNIRLKGELDFKQIPAQSITHLNLSREFGGILVDSENCLSRFRKVQTLELKRWPDYVFGWAVEEQKTFEDSMVKRLNIAAAADNTESTDVTENDSVAAATTLITSSTSSTPPMSPMTPMSTTSTTTATTTTAIQPVAPQEIDSLVPVRFLKLLEMDTVAVMDALDAFRHTLEQVEYTRTFLPNENEPLLKWDWLLPKLRHLKMDQGLCLNSLATTCGNNLRSLTIRTADRQFLVNMGTTIEGLKSLKLLESLDLQDLWDQTPKFNRTFSLDRKGFFFPNLYQVNLTGRWAIRIQGGFLAVSPKLQELTIAFKSHLSSEIDLRTFGTGDNRLVKFRALKNLTIHYGVLSREGTNQQDFVNLFRGGVFANGRRISGEEEDDDSTSSLGIFPNLRYLHLRDILYFVPDELVDLMMRRPGMDKLDIWSPTFPSLERCYVSEWTTSWSWNRKKVWHRGAALFYRGKEYYRNLDVPLIEPVVEEVVDDAVAPTTSPEGGVTGGATGGAMNGSGEGSAETSAASTTTPPATAQQAEPIG